MNVFKLAQLTSHIIINLKKIMVINIMLVQANSNAVMALIVMKNIIVKMIVIMQMVSKVKINYM